MTRRLPPASVLVIVTLASVTVTVTAACGSGSASVKPSPSGAKAEPRPPDCAVEFLRNPPSRTYDELGEIYGYYSKDVEPQDVLREKACSLGADAVIVTKDFVISSVSGPDRKSIAGTAIKYRTSNNAR
jgi:hypothetical protein